MIYERDALNRLSMLICSTREYPDEYAAPTDKEKGDLCSQGQRQILYCWDEVRWVGSPYTRLCELSVTPLSARLWGRHGEPRI